jgi:hypothetical protein
MSHLTQFERKMSAIEPITSIIVKEKLIEPFWSMIYDYVLDYKYFFHCKEFYTLRCIQVQQDGNYIKRHVQYNGTLGDPIGVILPRYDYYKINWKESYAVVKHADHRGDLITHKVNFTCEKKINYEEKFDPYGYAMVNIDCELDWRMFYIDVYAYLKLTSPDIHVTNSMSMRRYYIVSRTYKQPERSKPPAPKPWYAK